MLQVARLAPNLLRDSADLVAEFVQSQQDASGGFVGRAGEPDLYYTVFGIECLIALRLDPPSEAIAGYLRSFGGGEDLDLVHASCLGRCWAALPDQHVPGEVREHLLSRLAGHRTPEGGYHANPDASHGSAYGCFLATGLSQDLDAPVPDAEGIDRCLQGLATGDGGYANDTDITMGTTPATAAAVTLRHQLGLRIDPASGDWLLGRCHKDAGFFAMPEAPLPDLLSTATALHALAAMGRSIERIREPCLDFLDTLWTSRGAFYGHWAEEDDALDLEYTYYGLLALGHLSV
jgi:hypothetical protein